jgi:predicted sugar kinase
MADSVEGEEEGKEEDNLLEEINCLPDEYRNQLPDVQALSTFENILEVDDDAAGTVVNVLDKMMTSGNDVRDESSEEEELSVCTKNRLTIRGLRNAYKN